MRRMSYLANNRRLSGIILCAFIIISLVAIFSFIPQIPQWPSYHLFADTRSFLGISNFWNVISNLPFMIVSILGWQALMKKNHLMARQQYWVFLVMFIGIFLISVGSSYYHLQPDNARLIWDRIPMTLVFMSLLSLTIMQRINLQLGFFLWIPLLMFGIVSVLYWSWTEGAAHGDLRLYGLVQFYSVFLIFAILLLFPKSYPPLWPYVGMLIFYLLARVFEYYDQAVFHATGFISGHTLKHIFAAGAAYFLVIITKKYPG